MKRMIQISIIITIISFISCKGDEKQIIHRSFNSSIILNRQQFDTTLPNTIPLPELGKIISTGEITFDLNNDGINDIAFEIIDLHYYNGNMPDSLDSLAVRAIALNLDLLDNSTYGYADALNKDVLIDASGNWTTSTVVLGTFAGAGQFNGQGEKYLAFRFKNETDYNYGWVKLYCSTHNDTLRVISAGYNETANIEIMAGE